MISKNGTSNGRRGRFGSFLQTSDGLKGCGEMSTENFLFSPGL